MEARAAEILDVKMDMFVVVAIRDITTDVCVRRPNCCKEVIRDLRLLRIPDIMPRDKMPDAKKLPNKMPPKK